MAKRRFNPGFPPGLTTIGDDYKARILYHEDEAERKALPKLIALYQERVERLNKLVAGDCLEGAKLDSHVTDGSYALDRLSKPWRSGQERYQLILTDDRPKVIGGLHSHVSLTSTNGDATLIQGALAHLRKVRREVGQHIAALEAELESHPDQWQPLPTLGEFMAKGGDA